MNKRQKSFLFNSHEDTKNPIYNKYYLQICLPTISFFAKKDKKT